MKRFIAPLVLVAALAACGKSENKAAEGVSAPAPAAAIEIDGPSPGKWRMTTVMHGQAMPSAEICYDHKISFSEAQQMQKDSGVTCSENSFKREGGAVIGHSVCTMGEAKTKMTTDTRVTGDFNTAYTMDIVTSMDPAPMPALAHSEMQIKAERVGDCTKTQ